MDMRLLNSPIKIGAAQVKNRLVMPPMATAKSAEGGRVTDELLEYYGEKSKGGYIGLIIMEHAYVSPEGQAGRGQASIAEDGCISGLKSLAEVIHRNGSLVMAQISHAGGAAKGEITGRPVLGASAVSTPRYEAAPGEMTGKDIKKAVGDFAAAALRAKKAGFDGVEIHSAHGYLLNQFYSPLSNKRRDAYGGDSLEGRLRLHMEIIEAVREAVGRDYPLALRLGACDYMDGGTSLEDSVAAARMLERAGIDLLDISGGFCSYTRPGVTEQGYFSELTWAVKGAVRIPVLLTGGITRAEAAESLLEQGKADLIGVGRAILKDSLWAKRAVLGQ